MNKVVVVSTLVISGTIFVGEGVLNYFRDPKSVRDEEGKPRWRTVAYNAIKAGLGGALVGLGVRAIRN